MVPALGRRTFYLQMALIQNGKKIDGLFSTAQMNYRDQTQMIYRISGKIGKKDSIPSQLFAGKLLLDLLPEGIARTFWAFDDIRYLKNDTVEALYGNWLPNGSGSPRGDGIGGVFWVRKLKDGECPMMKMQDRVPEEPFPTKVVQPNTLNATQQMTIENKPPVVPIPTQMLARRNVEQGELVVDTKKITLSIYDNGVVDGDTVSIFFNGKLLLDHQQVSEKPIVLNIELDPNKARNELILFAENLGKISPNTSLIVVNAGDKRYELFSNANLEENAVLVFKYEPH
ncbi:MAG TPA: hypothetical protein VKH37_02540 [Ferruginibacter sp.]|nr:hypothetical protein [Ferruginibacter sp.]